MIDVEALAAATAQATTRRMLDRLRMTTLVPATVAEWGHDAGLVAVTFDGEDEATGLEPEPVPVANGTPGSLRPGERVLVMLYPPSGAVVVSLLGGYRPPTLTMGAAVATPTTNNTLTVLAFGALTGDDDVLDLVAGAIQVNQPGRYKVDATASADPNGNGHRLVELLLNGATRVGIDVDAAPPGTGWNSSFTTELDLDAGDTVAVRGRQTSGGDLPMTLSRFAMSRVAPLPAADPLS